MPQILQVPVQDLSLDLRNYRTVPQKNEASAVKAMVLINSDYFWGLTESLLDSGYLPTENIIILKAKSGKNNLVVKEGNRRIAAMKLIFGLLSSSGLDMPGNISKLINDISPEWIKDNSTVPCTIYEHTDANKVDRIVSLAHGKGEKASRDKWESVATARHNRDANKVPEPALDLLENYLIKGQNITDQQRERWAGHYPISVLADAMKRLAPRLGALNAPDLATKYSDKIKYLTEFETVLHAIGQGRATFGMVRSTEIDFGSTYGILPVPNSTANTPAAGTPPAGTHTAGTPAAGTPAAGTPAAGTPAAGAPAAGAPAAGAPAAGTPAAGTLAAGTPPVGTPAFAINDPRAVKKLLNQLSPQGPNRDKVVTLRNEALNLNIKNTPIAFCFLLRSMFEISAKAYCNQHSLPMVKKDGKDKNGKDKFKDKTLVELLTDITIHLHQNKTNGPMLKKLHGPLTELSRPDGILSVTSMNHLVHNPSFSVVPGDICTLFGNVYPLLEHMN
jgi:hypothetical protein